MKQAKAKAKQPGTTKTQPHLKLIPKKVLVPIDFSETSLEAWRYALEYAAQFGAELVLLHVVEPAPFIADLANVPLVMSDKEAVRAAERKLATLTPPNPRLSVPTHRVVRIGRAYQAIIEEARKQRAELIIISTHGYTGIKHTLLGSTTERVVRHASCPVLVVRKLER